MSSDPLNQHLEAIGWTKYHTYCFIVCGCAWASDMLWSINISITMVGASQQFNLSSVQSGILSTLFMIGMFIGSYSWGYLADRKSRMFVFKKTGFLTMCGGFLGVFSYAYWMLVIACFVVGMGVGGQIAVGGTVYSQFCPTSKLWTLVLLAACWCLGGMISALSAIVFQTGPLGLQVWRWVFIFSSILSFVFWISRIKMVETPRFLFAQSKIGACNKSLKRISGDNKEYLDSLIPPQGGIKSKKDQRYIKELFNPVFLKSTILFSIIYFGANFSSGGLLLFMPTLLEQEGISGISYTMYSIILAQQASGIPGILIASYAVDTRLGRKYSMAIPFICCGVFGILFLTASNLPMIITSTCLINFFSYMGYSAMYTIVPQTYPTRIRNTAVGWANASNKIGGVLAPTLFGVFLQLQGGFYIIVLSAAIFFITIGCLSFLTRETRGIGLNNSEQ